MNGTLLGYAVLRSLPRLAGTALAFGLVAVALAGCVADAPEDPAPVGRTGGDAWTYVPDVGTTAGWTEWLVEATPGGFVLVRQYEGAQSIELLWGNASGLYGWALLKTGTGGGDVLSALVYDAPCGYPLAFHALPDQDRSCDAVFHIVDDAGQTQVLADARPTEVVRPLEASRVDLPWASFDVTPLRVDFSLGVSFGVNPPDAVVYHRSEAVCAPPRIDRTDFDGGLEKRWNLAGARCGETVLGDAPPEVPAAVRALIDAGTVQEAHRVCAQPPLAVGAAGTPVDPFEAACPAEFFHDGITAAAAATAIVQATWESTTGAVEHTLQVGDRTVSGPTSPLELEVSFDELQAADQVVAYAPVRDDPGPYTITATYHIAPRAGHGFGLLIPS